MEKTYVSTQDLVNLGWNRDKVTEEMVAQLNRTLVEYNITTPLKIQHFLSQATQECDKGNGITEYASGKGYEGRKDLGNTISGDGPKYKGAGAIHITGRNNYQAFADDIGDQRVMEGSEYVAANYPWKSAGYWWSQNHMNERIDDMIKSNKSPSAMVDEVSRVVNAGAGGRLESVNGLENRHLYYDRAVETNIGAPKRVIDTQLKIDSGLEVNKQLRMPEDMARKAPGYEAPKQTFEKHPLVEGPHCSMSTNFNGKDAKKMLDNWKEGLDKNLAQVNSMKQGKSITC